MKTNSKVKIIGKEPDELRELLSTYQSIDTQLLLVCLNNSQNNNFKVWMEDYVTEVITYLKGCFQKVSHTLDRPERLLIIVLGENKADIFQESAKEAFWGAVRGIVHTITIEESAKYIRLNAIYAEEGCEAELSDILDFLSKSTGDFCAGCTYDVRCWV